MKVSYLKAFTICLGAWWRGAKGHRLREFSNPIFWYDFVRHIVPPTQAMLNKNIEGLDIHLTKISFSMDPESQIYDPTVITKDGGKIKITKLDNHEPQV